MALQKEIYIKDLVPGRPVRDIFIITDAKTGQASVSFGLSDAVTSFRVFADAFADSGALGAHSMAIESVEPFYIEPKLPLEVTMGDRVIVPIGVVNGTSAALSGPALTSARHAGTFT